MFVKHGVTFFLSLTKTTQDVFFSAKCSVFKQNISWRENKVENNKCLTNNCWLHDEVAKALPIERGEIFKSVQTERQTLT